MDSILESFFAKYFAASDDVAAVRRAVEVSSLRIVKAPQFQPRIIVLLPLL